MNNEEKRQAILAKMTEFEEQFGGRTNLPEVPAAVDEIFKAYDMDDDFFVKTATTQGDEQAAVKKVQTLPPVMGELFWLRYDLQSLAYDLSIMAVLLRSLGISLHEEGLGEGIKGQRLTRQLKEILEKSIPSAASRAYELLNKINSEDFAMDVSSARRHVAKSDLFDEAKKLALTDYLRYLRKQLTVLKQEAQDYVDWAKGFSEIQ